MSKTVRTLAVAALLVFGGATTAHATTGGAGSTSGRTVSVAIAATPCMAC